MLQSESEAPNRLGSHSRVNSKDLDKGYVKSEHYSRVKKRQICNV